MAQSEDVRKRFSREIEILASLEHENVMPVEDSGETRTGIPWFVMPKADHPFLAACPVRVMPEERLGTPAREV